MVGEDDRGLPDDMMVMGPRGMAMALGRAMHGIRRAGKETGMVEINDDTKTDSGMETSPACDRRPFATLLFVPVIIITRSKVGLHTARVRTGRSRSGVILTAPPRRRLGVSRQRQQAGRRRERTS